MLNLCCFSLLHRDMRKTKYTQWYHHIFTISKSLDCWFDSFQVSGNFEQNIWSQIQNPPRPKPIAKFNRKGQKSEDMLTSDKCFFDPNQATKKSSKQTYFISYDPSFSRGKNRFKYKLYLTFLKEHVTCNCWNTFS